MVLLKPVLKARPGFAHGALPVYRIVTSQGRRTVGGAVQVVQLVRKLMEDDVMGAVRVGDRKFTLAPGEDNPTLFPGFAGTGFIRTAHHQAVMVDIPDTVDIGIDQDASDLVEI